MDPVAEELGHPSFLDIQAYERRLPQSVAASVLVKASERPRYLFFPNAAWGSGLLYTHLAHLSDRAYVFPAYTPNDHPPFPDTLANGTRHFLTIPMNAFVSGPTGGGPLSADGKTDKLMRRSISEEWWNVVCPPKHVVVVNLYELRAAVGVDDTSEGKDILSSFAAEFLKMSAPCVSFAGGTPFDYLFFGSPRVLSVWPSYGDSPTLKYFAWSPLISAALFRNFHLLSHLAVPNILAPSTEPPYIFTSFSPYPSSSPHIDGLLGLHVRRGDYEGHCAGLAYVGAGYNSWSLLGTPGLSKPEDGFEWPNLPDYLDAHEGESQQDAVLRHCWPSSDAIVARVRRLRVLQHSLRRVYISTNGEREWVDGLAALLRAEGWEVASSLDLELTQQQRAVSQAVDMSILVAAESFVGVGFSSLTSNVVQIRLGAGRPPNTIHFW
ncbi:hypothetical protein C8R46DRAFT_1005481 [Mycena filopes]|nr:hypothetical protein C8R46DRAFT_1005481 [Mycena filopes]